MKSNEMPITGIDGEVLGYWSTNSGKFKAVLQKATGETYHAIFYQDGILKETALFTDREKAIKETVSKINDIYFVDGWIYKTRAGNIRLKWEKSTAEEKAPCLF